jgi:hypothetical protein
MGYESRSHGKPVMSVKVTLYDGGEIGVKIEQGVVVERIKETAKDLLEEAVNQLAGQVKAEGNN